MSDTSAPAAPPTSTPAPASTPAPSPVRSEVPVNESPVHHPKPIGPQSVPATSNEERRRASLEAAFKRAENPPGKPAAKPAEAKPAPAAAEARKGHNQPPEDAPQEKLDLRKRPADQPRSERGTFAPRPQDPQAPHAERAGQPGQPAQPQRARQLPEGAPYRDPPPRISERARQDWDTAPESVRADYHRLHQEADGIHRHYKAVADAYQPLAPYDQLARQQGTTLQQALSNYVGIEHKLRADPVAALDTIVYNLGMTDPQTGQRIGLRDIAYHVLSQSPDQLRVMQQGNQQQAASQQIGALHQQLNAQQQQLRQLQIERQFHYTRSAVDQFAEQHPRFDELGALIENELKLGFDLPTAYRRAELLSPGTTAAQTRDTPAQTRQTTDRSIHGNPDVAPSNGASRRSQKPSASPREALQNAMARMLS